MLKRPRPAESFFLNFRWSVRRFWLPALLAPLVVTAILVAGLFWWSAATPARWIALVVVCCAGGLALAGCLALLGVTATSSRADRFTDVGRAALDLVRARPLALAGTAALELIWILLAAHFPTVLLVGSGLIPAGIVWYVVMPPALRNHE